jgi:hypothetical protein
MVLVFGSRYIFLTGLPFLNGPDAYYYALQIRFFIADGVLKIPDSSPLLQLMGYTGKLGMSCEQTIVLWTVLIQVLCGVSVFAAYRLMRKENNQGIIPGLLVAWTFISPTLTFTCIEFPKYAFALIFMPLWPVALNNKRLWPVSAGAIIFSAVSHLTMIGIALVLLAGWAVFGGLLSLIRVRAGSKRPVFRWPVLAIGIVLLVMLAAFWGGKFLMPADLKRIELQGLQPGLWTFLSRDGIPQWLKGEVLGAAVVCIGLAIWAFRDTTRRNTLFWLPFAILLLIIPFGSKEMMGIPERLCLALPLMAITMLAGTRFVLPKWFGIPIGSLIFVILGLAAFFSKEYLASVHPDRFNPDYPLYDQVTQAIGGRDIPMLISHQGLNYYYKYKTMKESFPYEPESHWPKTRIWRVVFGITPSTWAYYLPKQDLWGGGLLFSLPAKYTLVREDLWVQFRDQLRTSQDEELRVLVFHSWLNPSQKRPEFARKRAEKDNDGEFSAYP